MTEREKMLAGEVYDACDAELLTDLNRVKVLCRQYNNLLPTDFAARTKMLCEMLGQADDGTSGRRHVHQPAFLLRLRQAHPSWETVLRQLWFDGLGRSLCNHRR